MGTSILTNALMTMVNGQFPTSNYDYATSVFVRKAAGTAGETRVLVYFTRPFPLGATITDAKLVLYNTVNSQSGTISADVKRIKTPVSFSKITWTTRPTTYYSGTYSLSKTGPLAGGVEWSFDVTAAMQSVSLGDLWYGFEVSTTTALALNFYEANNSAVTYRPRLEVTWSDAPAKPVGLAPGGGRAISGTKPIVRCSYVDVSGATEMQSIQVQANATNVWTSPTFDSGTVASSTPELDLSTTAFAAMTDGQVVYWRARVRDMAGLWSEWSDGDSFTRDTKGTLTLTAPSSGTPTVEDSTPPFTWTFTGETQTSYQLTIVETTTGGQAKQWTTGKITSTVTTVTPPAGVINSPDSTYVATLRVWDAKARETIPSDPAYTEVTRSFTYVPTATVTATTALAATAVFPYPRVALTWQRTTAPDSFSILRNRQVIASGILPGDVFVSGTAYSWTDKSAPPQTTLLYEVQAIVNSKASASNATTSTTMTSRGIWLADSDRVNEVMITGKPDRDFTYGESSEPVEVVGGSEIVLVTQSLRGIEGRITGELHGGVVGLSTTAQQWRDKLLNIKAKPGQRCWLTFGDRTIRCVIRNVSIAPRGNAQLSFSVGFDFYQVGTLDYVPSL
jgi:hypothetical protein